VLNAHNHRQFSAVSGKHYIHSTKMDIDKLLIASNTLFNKNNSICLSVYDGKGYLIDVSKKEIILNIDNKSLIQSSIQTYNPDYFILGTFNNIYVLDEQGIKKQIEPNFTVDGIYFEKQEQNKALGNIYMSENQYETICPFSMDLNTFSIEVDIIPRKNFSLIEKLFFSIAALFKTIINANR
jgi:hypothetical protein